MYQRYEITLETNSSGAATGYSPPIFGRIFSIQYVKDDFADGVDFTITLCNEDNTDGTAESLWTDTNINASEKVCPRQPTHDQAGDASLYAAAGEAVEDYFVACGERVKIVIAQGGDTKSGKFYIKAG